MQVHGAAQSVREGRRAIDRDWLTVTGLAFVAGFVDAAAFVALAGLFTAHVTGNFVLIGAELVSTSNGVIAKLCALPAFVLAVAATRLIALALERRRIGVLRALLGLEALVLACFGAFGLALGPFPSPDSAPAVCVGMLGVIAMGIQNATGRLALGHLAATTVMTVNVTQTVLDVTDLLRGERGDGDRTRARLRRMLPAVLAFAIGALAGAFGIAAWSFWCLVVPVLALAALMIVSEPIQDHSGP
ncbi:YoaK family protein [uncultured Methylobacterium sp.]|uniref:YoaK family protein n=1 Tax=uncultured Methylobacterium sp. TaxID=157278 RepID=UPI0035C9E586